MPWASITRISCSLSDRGSISPPPGRNAAPRVREAISGWSGRVGDPQASALFAQHVRRLRWPLTHSFVLNEVRTAGTAWHGFLPDTQAHRQFLHDLGADPVISGEALCVPLCVDGRVVAVVFACNPSGKELSGVEILKIFVQQAGLMIERAALERRLISLVGSKRL